MSDLSNKRAIITAGASGIGRVTARTFIAAGARVSVCDIDDAALASFMEEFPSASAFLCDVSKPAAVARVTELMVEALGGIDILVNNAGSAGPTANIEDIDTDDWSRTVDVNLFSQFLFTKALVPLMKAQRSGAIVHMSSAAGRLGMPMRTPYVAAKWATIGLTQSLAMELGGHNIRVNAILPGSVRGDRMGRVMKARSEATGLSLAQVEAEETAAISLGRMIEPQEIADMIAFICSDRGSAISGQSIGVCGNTEILR
ncbi:SDR family oxidoreductase [Mesorhizobium shangrilense]|uniref:SDR family oxidoreductase n=1 Tax=Mesorhizobium shangrilense TaxID=460060 RepID=A0ABV2DLT6_9HYPH